MVGSGTAAPEPGRVCSCYFVDAGATRILLDCGPGAVHHLARLRLPWRRLDHLLLSHFHNDHIGDIPMLLFALKWGAKERRTEPLTVWGPVGTRERMRRLADALGDHVSDPGFPLEIRELAPGERAGLAPEVTAACTKTPHTDESVGYRLELAGERAGGSVGYTGDTGPSDEVAAFMAGVDVLVAECSLPDEEAIPTHLSPSSLARMAIRAAPARLVVTHVYPWLDAQDVVARVREAGWTGATTRAEDGLRFGAAESRR